ncbi:conjugal transfer protein TrbL, partial [Campylobacter fetus subsp. testudinum]
MKQSKSIAQTQTVLYSYVAIVSIILTRKALSTQSSKLFVIFILLSIPNLVFGVDTPDSVFNLLGNGLQGWIPTVKSAALYVFFALATIDLVWTFGIQALRGFEIGEFLATLVKKVIFIGVMIFLFNVDFWLKLLFESFSQLATNVSGGLKIGPNNIIESAFKVVLSILKTLDFDIGLSF